ncbi:hypothetical protein [Streptomyces yangpuensis]|uniref:hypothetical protein n=1 Tax=Streptomyces yangpuensis TaxID=1648182 RepID=UPI0036486FD9
MTTEFSGPGDRTVRVSAFVGREDVVEGRLRLTVEKIDRLGAGKGLTGVKGETAMDRATFLKPSSERCKP